MKKRYILMSLVLSILIGLSLMSNVRASPGPNHSDGEMIDIESGFVSDIIVLEWEENKSFMFEITSPSEYTFEILDLNGTLYWYEFKHFNADEANNTNSTASSFKLFHEGEDNGNDTTTSQIFNADGLPYGTHVEKYVKRRLNFTETGNYTLLLSHSHAHEEPPVQFKFKITPGWNGGEEVYGRSDLDQDTESNSASTPGFEFIAIGTLILPAIFAVWRKKRNHD